MRRSRLATSFVALIALIAVALPAPAFARAGRFNLAKLEKLRAKAEETKAQESFLGFLGLEHEDQAERQTAFLDAHRDDFGVVRPDLWQKGLEDALDLKVSATWPTVDGIDAGLLNHPARSSAPQEAGAPAPADPVVGVQWRQIGPGPLRIDDNTGEPSQAWQGDNYTFQGDGPTSGEVTDVAIDPRGTTDSVVYIATNDGGVWKTVNGGTSWTPMSDNETSLSIGAVALDPSNPNIVYAGTGNGYDGGCFFTKGVGILKSVDGGGTWTTLGSALFNNVMIHRIRVLNDGTMLVGTSSGLFRSIDGGLNFGNNSPSFDNGQAELVGNATDIDIDTATPTTIYASMGTGGRCPSAAAGTTGVFQSTDSGENFTNLFTATNGGLTGAYRVLTFAQGTDNAQVMYASAGGSGSNYFGMVRSADGGTNWAPAAGAAGAAGDNGGCQCSYDHTLGVDPLDSNDVYLGFQELYLSTDAGANFTPGTPVSLREIHWDQHALVFSPASHVPAGSTSTPVWAGHDGGISRSADGGANWTNLNEGIATQLFKEIDMGRGSGNNGFTYGGTQDTGTIQDRPGYPGTDWHLGIDGDGLTVAVDPSDPNHALAVDNGGWTVTTDGGDNWTFPPGGLSFGHIEWDLSDAQNVWAAGPSNGFGSGPQLYRSTDNGGTFSTAATPFAANINAIEVSRQDSNDVWVGLSNGRVARSINALGVAPLFGASLNVGPTRPVSDLAIDPDDPNTVVVTYQGFSNTAAGLRTEHVYMTTDGGTTWNDISGTDGGTQNLPDLPTNSVVIDSATTPATIIVSNDAGVMRTTDSGATWQRLGTGLPLVDSVTLVLDDSVSPPVLRLGTYGRSVFELGAASGPALSINGDLNFDRVAVGGRATRQVQLFNTGTADLHVLSFNRSEGSAEFSISSGPDTPVTIRPGAHVDYTVEFKPTSVGDKTATFRVNSDDPASPHDLPASGTGVSGSAFVSPGSMFFGGIPVDNRTNPHSADDKATIYNQASCDGCDVQVISATITGPEAADYELVGPPTFPYKIGPGNHLDLTVRFNPSDLGTRSATLTVTTDDPTNPNSVVSLDGSGIVPWVEAAPDSLIFPPTVVDPVCVGPCGEALGTTINNPGQAELIVDRYTFATTGYPAAFSDAGGSLAGQRLAANTNIERSIMFRPTGNPARAVRGTLTVADDGSPGPGDVPAKTVSFCGEATGRGIRVLTVDRFGTPVTTVKDLKLQSQGVSPSVNISARSLATTTINPPTSCVPIQYQYENQNLPATLAGKPDTSYYNLDVTVQLSGQDVHLKASFTLAANEFKTIVLTTPKADVPFPTCGSNPTSVAAGAPTSAKLTGSGFSFTTPVDVTIDGDPGQPVTSVLTDAAGKFTTNTTIPGILTQGTHVLFFRGPDQNGDPATCVKVITVKAPSGAPNNPTCSLKPADGTVGASTQALFSGANWAPTSSVDVSLDGSQPVLSAPTNANGKFDSLGGAIPVSYEQGKHAIIYTGLLSDGITMGSCANEYKVAPR